MSPGLDDRRVAALLLLLAAMVWTGAQTHAHAGVLAIAWDYAFLLAYGLFLALACSGLGTLCGNGWEKLGGAAALAALAAATCDAVENAAQLHALEGSANGARVAALAGFGKWALVAFAAAAFVWLVLRSATGDTVELKPLPVPLDTKQPTPARKCDIVMKGGITSGIVYPRAVGALAKHYRFVNVGGASAGAIAAGATAAAEYARSQGRDAFAVLDLLPAWLGRGGRLFGLFQPNPKTRAPFEVFVAFLGSMPAPYKAARALATAAAYYPLWLAAALLPPGLIAYGALRTSHEPAWAVTGAVLAAAVLIPLALTAGLAVSVLRALPKNGFGLSSGHVLGQTLLSAWLDELLCQLAGTKQPLTFQDLWSAYPVDTPGERAINFEALTTSLSEGRPYRFPDLGRRFYFRSEDLEAVLPARVVRWLEQHPDPAATPVPGFHALPAAKDLPVVLAVRLSLSFPFLLSAVRFWAFDHTGSSSELQPCWLSDGGMSSNFPIHFFDGLVPGHPTFGLDLGPFHPRYPRDAADESKNVFLPAHHNSGHAVRINRISGVGGFVGALMNAMQAFYDNMQMRHAGYRDRVARVFLDAEEGGLNLTMPPELLERLGARGAAAGEKLVERFVHGDAWRNHRWVRLRSLFAMIDPMLKDFATQMHDLSWLELLDEERHYAMSPEQRARAKQIIGALQKLGDAAHADMSADAPNPAPVLRGTPRV